MDEKYRLACGVCGNPNDLLLIPAEGAEGPFIGFVFVCQSCLEITDGCRISVHLGTDLISEVDNFLGGES